MKINDLCKKNNDKCSRNSHKTTLNLRKPHIFHIIKTISKDKEYVHEKTPKYRDLAYSALHSLHHVEPKLSLE